MNKIGLATAERKFRAKSLRTTVRATQRPNKLSTIVIDDRAESLLARSIVARVVVIDTSGGVNDGVTVFDDINDDGGDNDADCDADDDGDSAVVRIASTVFVDAVVDDIASLLLAEVVVVVTIGFVNDVVDDTLLL